ncbi:hypothetical protein PG994_004009 [Apiospora phragmitis]|uniref:Mediator complex subunit 15 KIX domain-containing protein n=1 Tax=Apiospora phragmitis TaxID=2905665 RepID=A0ABR1VZU6_9PEZI
MPQMGGGGPTQGWQNSVHLNIRVGNAMNLISNSFLALPHLETEQLVHTGINFEREAFQTSPDKPTYESKVSQRIQELFRKRQANEQHLQNSLNQQAAAQAHAQAQAQMFMNQNAMHQMSRGMVQPSPQGFQHLQQPMQASPIPQQPQQPGMGMPNMGGNPMNPNMHAMQMGASPMHPQGGPQMNINGVPPQARAKAHQLALAKLQTTPEDQKRQLRAMVQSKMSAHHLQRLQAEGQDPLLVFFQNQMLMQAAGKQGQPNMHPNAGMNQAMQMQQAQQQQRSMNQAGQQHGSDLGPFSNEIINQQKAGMLAQEAGQMVVPASIGLGRNTTPQPPRDGRTSGAAPGEQPAGPESEWAAPTHATAAAAQSQAQIRAQAQAKAQMQGQPGGLSGPGGVSQSPAMSTLNAPVGPNPPVAGMRPNSQQSPMHQGNPAFGQGLDPRFNQGNQRPQMNPNVRQQMINAMLQQMPPQMRESFQAQPVERVNEMLAKWSASRGGQVPGRQQAQPGQFGQGNAMAQFTQGNNPNMPQPNAAAGANPQNNMMVQQHLNRMRNPQPQVPNNSQAMNFMNQMDVPPRVLTQLANIPPEIKKWGQLKAWVPTQPLPPNVGDQLLTFQLQQFRTMLAQKPQLAQAAGIQVPQPQPGPGPVAQQPSQGVGAPGAAGPPQVTIPPQLANAFASIQVTAHEIETARRHDRFKTWDEAKIRSYLVQMKQHQIRQKFGMQMPGQPQFAPQPPGAAAPPTQPPPAGPGAMPRGPNAGNEAPPSVVPARNSTQGQPPSNRPTPQQNASPAVPPKNNLKRPSTDDAADVPNASATPMQRPPSQQAPPPNKPPILTQAQLANLAPDQRAKYEQLMRNHRAVAQQQPTHTNQEDIERLRQIGAEEQRASNNEQLQDVIMNPEQHADMTTKIQRMVFEMSKLGRALGRWYSLTHDDNRARMFFRMRMRLVRQFKDGEKMTTPKEVFSVKPKELEQVRAMMESIAKDLAASFPQAVRKTASQQNAADGAAQQTTPGQTATAPSAQPAPLNAANLEKNSQALNKMHQGQRNQQPPAAPTTSQPPFPLGAPSPHGLPAYGNKPAVTADNLHLPTSRKKPKTTASASVSPQVSKQASPQMQKQGQSAEMKALPKAQFQCAMPDCEANSIGFRTEEASRAHHEEEHVKPFQDPAAFASENLAFALGLDANGKSSAMAPAGGFEQGASPTGATSMAREASMKRSESASGAKPGIRKGVPGKAAEQQNADVNMIKAEGQTPAQSNNMDFGFGMSTIDPQELFQFGLESGGGGAIMDMGVYRSITPNDTPESSKDSASSEPNSDVSEGVTLDVRLDLGLDTWQPFEGDSFVNPGAMDMEISMFDGAQPMVMDNSALAGFTSWDEVNQDFNKPFALDTSLYSLDTSS